jgi:hypothetical protein
MTTNIDSLSLNISQALKRKYPDIDYNHYAPAFVKDYISKTQYNYSTKDGVQKIIAGLTQSLNYFREKISKERQSKGTVDFTLSPANQSNQTKTKPIPQQKLVIPNKINEVVHDNSRREFLNKNPLIIDPGMIPNINNPNQPQQVYLNQIDTTNSEYNNNYKSFPGNPNQKDSDLLSSLSNLPTEINQSDRFILTDKQKNLIKEETGEWIYYLVIDSKDRDMNIFKTPSEYTIRFSPPSFNNKDVRTGFVDRILHNVKSIELIKCAFLDTSNISDASDSNNQEPPYIMLEIEEFGTNHNGTNQFLNKSLAVLDSYTKQGKYKYYHVIYNDEPMINRFNPRITIDKMTIRFRLPDGTLYNFGNSNNTNLTTVNYLLFKINVVQRVLETNYLNQTDG